MHAHSIHFAQRLRTSPVAPHALRCTPSTLASKHIPPPQVLPLAAHYGRRLRGRRRDVPGAQRRRGGGDRADDGCGGLEGRGGAGRGGVMHLSHLRRVHQVTTLDLEKPLPEKGGKVDYAEDFFGKPSYLTVSGICFVAFVSNFRDALSPALFLFPFAAKPPHARAP